jgi:hypothetical protein
MFMSDSSALVTPQKATLDYMRKLLLFVSCLRLSPQFQVSLSAAALGMYLYGRICRADNLILPTLQYNISEIRVWNIGEERVKNDFRNRQ